MVFEIFAALAQASTKKLVSYLKQERVLLSRGIEKDCAYSVCRPN
jgi:hypothetical protein